MSSTVYHNEHGRVERSSSHIVDEVAALEREGYTPRRRNPDGSIELTDRYGSRVTVRRY